jgi:hypothetical protein
MRRVLRPSALAIVFVALIGAAAPSMAQDSLQEQADLIVKKNEISIDKYMAKHPVPQSASFLAAAAVMTVLGKFDAMIGYACENDPDLPDWYDSTGGMPDNVIIALSRSYRAAMKKYRDETPFEIGAQDASLCIDEMRHRDELFRNLKSVFANLRKRARG